MSTRRRQSPAKTITKAKRAEKLSGGARFGVHPLDALNDQRVEVSGDPGTLGVDRGLREPRPLLLELGNAALQLSGDVATSCLSATGEPDHHQVWVDAVGEG